MAETQVIVELRSFVSWGEQGLLLLLWAALHGSPLCQMLVFISLQQALIYLNFSLCFLAHLRGGFVILVTCVRRMFTFPFSVGKLFSNIFITRLEPAVVPFDLLLSCIRYYPLFTSEMLWTCKTVIVGNRSTEVLSIGVFFFLKFLVLLSQAYLIEGAVRTPLKN